MNAEATCSTVQSYLTGELESELRSCCLVLKLTFLGHIIIPFPCPQRMSFSTFCGLGDVPAI